MNEPDKMDSKLREAFEKQLLRERAVVSETINKPVVGPIIELESELYDAEDSADQLIEMYKENSLLHDKAKKLTKIDHALDRLEKGTYGVCEECGEKIDLERLKISPSTELCLDCQQDLEHYSRRIA